MSPELLALIAGTFLSLVFSYVPKLNKAFAQLEGDYKRLIMLGALLLSALGVFGLSCANWYDLVSCDVAGVKELIEIFILSAIANQGAYMLTPKGKQ
jgi:hypothetical protein